MTLEAQVNERFESMENLLKKDTIQRIDTYHGNHQAAMDSLKETLLNQFQALGTKMVSTLQENQDRLKALELQVVLLTTSNTNLKQDVIGLTSRLQELDEHEPNKQKVRNDEQIEVSNAPTGSAALTNSTASLSCPSGALLNSRMTGETLVSHQPLI
jgi:hypothetical protein